jgi:hypothetical protein
MTYKGVKNFIESNLSLFNTEYDRLTFEYLCEAIIDIIQHKDDKDYDVISSIYKDVYKPFLKSMLEHQNDLINTISDLMKYGTKITLSNKDYENVKAELIKKCAKEKPNTLYEYDVYYIHNNQSYVFKVAALNEIDARYRALHALRIYEDLKIYDIVKI